jgi:hypothetical protein
VAISLADSTVHHACAGVPYEKINYGSSGGFSTAGNLAIWRKFLFTGADSGWDDSIDRQMGHHRIANNRFYFLNHRAPPIRGTDLPFHSAFWRRRTAAAG